MLEARARPLVLHKARCSKKLGPENLMTSMLEPARAFAPTRSKKFGDKTSKTHQNIRIKWVKIAIKISPKMVNPPENTMIFIRELYELAGS